MVVLLTVVALPFSGASAGPGVLDFTDDGAFVLWAELDDRTFDELWHF